MYLRGLPNLRPTFPRIPETSAVSALKQNIPHTVLSVFLTPTQRNRKTEKREQKYRFSLLVKQIRFFYSGFLPLLINFH